MDKNLKKAFKNIFEAYYENENEEIDGYLGKSTEYIVDYLYENNEVEFSNKLCNRKYKLKELILKCSVNEDDYLRVGQLHNKLYYIQVTEERDFEISKSTVNLDKDSLIKLYKFIGDYLK